MWPIIMCHRQNTTLLSILSWVSQPLAAVVCHHCKPMIQASSNKITTKDSATVDDVDDVKSSEPVSRARRRAESQSALYEASPTHDAYAMACAR